MRTLFVTLLAALALVAVMLTPSLVGTAQAATSAPAGASSASAGLTPAHQTHRKAKARHQHRFHTHRHKHGNKTHTHKHRHGRHHATHSNSNSNVKLINRVQTWNRLAHCESTSRWFVNTGNGYYGGLQISPSTWRGYGGARFAALPHHASKAEQIMIGKRIKHGQGWGAWPSCSRKVGLR